MKKYLSFIIFLLIFSQNIFSEDEKNIINLPGKKRPAKMKIGVHKLKTEELQLEFNAKEKIIYGEIPNYNDELVFISENLEEIPSIKTVGGKRIIHKIKKIKPNEPIKHKTLTYEVIKKAETLKSYIKVSPNKALGNIYIYLLDSKTYNIKKVYKGKLITDYETRYIETTVLIDNPMFNLDKNNGWLKLSASQYNTEEENISWGSVINPIDIPVNANLEIFTKDWKSLGNNLVTRLPIGKDSSINLAYKKGENFIALGYKNEDFNLNGAEETYYLKFTKDDKSLLFIQKLNIKYKKVVPISNSTTIDFLNPLVSDGGGKSRGVVYFNGSNWSEGMTIGLSNVEISDYDGNRTHWFKIRNGVDYNLGDDDIIYIYDKNGKLYGNIDKFTKSAIKIGEKDGKEIFYLYYDIHNKALGVSFNGAIYDGNSLTEKFYLRLAKKNRKIKSIDLPAGEILNELVINLPEFKPESYFGYRDSNRLGDSSGKWKVGVGVEKLVTLANHSGQIDLKTEITSLGYYLEFLHQMRLENDGVVYGKPSGKVKVMSNIKGDPVLEGVLYFSSMVKDSPEFVAVSSLKNMFDIYLHLEPKEYKKLLPNRHYKIMDFTGAEDVIYIGITKNGDFLNKPLTKKFDLNTNLSFITLPTFVEIYPQNLDFGKFNSHGNQNIRESSAKIAINGNNIRDFSVKIANDMDKIDIYKENLDETTDKDKFISVNNLRIEKISEEIKLYNPDTEKKYTNQVYELFGTAFFDPNKNLPEGNYSNNLVIEVTIID